MLDFGEKFQKFIEGSPLEDLASVDDVGASCPGPGSEGIYMRGYIDRAFTFFDGIVIQFDYCEPDIAAETGIECLSPFAQMQFMNSV